jgi:hypothetical protein
VAAGGRGNKDIVRINDIVMINDIVRIEDIVMIVLFEEFMIEDVRYLTKAIFSRSLVWL